MCREASWLLASQTSQSTHDAQPRQNRGQNTLECDRLEKEVQKMSKCFEKCDSAWCNKTTVNVEIRIMIYSSMFL